MRTSIIVYLNKPISNFIIKNIKRNKVVENKGGRPFIDR